MGPVLLAKPIDACHLAGGVFSYDLVELFEQLPTGAPEPAVTPHFEFVIPDRLIIVDHLRHRTLVVATAVGGPDGEANYHDAVDAIGRHDRPTARPTVCRPTRPPVRRPE